MSHRRGSTGRGPAVELVGRRELGPARWDALVEASDDAWLWHLYDLREPDCADWPASVDLSFGAVDRAGRLIALVPLFRAARMRRPHWQILHSEGGLAIANDLDPAEHARLSEVLLNHVRALARTHRAMDIRILLCPLAPRFHGESRPQRNPLVDLGARDMSDSTWMVDLSQGSDAAWAGMRRGARSNVRKAHQNKVSVRSARLEDLPVYLRLYEETAARTGLPRYPPGHHQAFWQLYLERSLARVLIAEHEGEPVAILCSWIGKGAAMLAEMVSSAAALRVGANSLLYWRSIQWMCEHGIEWYDLGVAALDSDAKLRSIGEFKAGLGARLHPFYIGRFPSSQARSLTRDVAAALRAATRASANRPPTAARAWQ
jgi:hypothetical protein